MLPRSRGEWLLAIAIGLAAIASCAGFGYFLAVQQRWIAFPRSIMFIEPWHPWAAGAVAAAFVVLYAACRNPPS